jgi:hypothetical protein
MPVSTKHKAYQGACALWSLVRDCAAGPHAVKAKRTKYLPMPNPEDTSEANTARYNAYLTRANFVNFTGPTINGLLGMVFRDDVNIQLPPDLEYLVDNANGNGTTLDQLIRRVVAELLTTGRVGLLVDYPEAPEGLSRAEVRRRNLRANILVYTAESVLNWRTATEGGVTKTSLVVLNEPREVVGDDGFETETKDGYRVLRYENGVYTQELYDDTETLVSITAPRQSDGSAWDEIPFIIVGSENNDLTVDKAPVYDIAEINLSHYRNSADFEDSAFMVGQPTPVIAGLTHDWAEKIMKGGIMLGSRTGLLLPEGADASLLQATDNLMPERGMEAKERQLVKVGARIIEDQRGNETVDAANMRFASATSPLDVIVGNTESALHQCLEWAGQFMGTDTEIELSINREFYDRTIDAQSIIANIQLLDRGVLAMSDLRNNLRASGVIDNDRTDDDIDGEAEQSDPLQ